jgi:hypothetical protein
MLLSLIAGLILLLGVRAAWAAEPSTTFRIASTEDAAAKLAAPRLSEAYQRLGLRMQIEPMPLNRARHQIQRGQLDGEMLRADLYFEQEPSVVKVPVVLVTTQFWLLRRPPCPARVELAALERASVLYPRGTTALEQALPARSQIPVSPDVDLFAMLKAGRATYAVVVGIEHLPLATSSQLGGLCVVAEPLMQRQLYHALHRDHAALVAPLAEALATLPRP